MKTILVALLVAGVTMSAGAADFIPGTQPANEIMPKASGPIKSQADAVTAPARIDREAAPAVNSKPLTGIVNVEESTKPGLPTNSDAAPVPANVVAAPAKKAEEAAPEKAAAPAVVPDQVLPLQDLVAFHEKEIESLKQLIAQWSMQIQTTIERRQDLEKTIESRARRLEELRQEGTKTSRAQAAQLNKEIARLKKDQSAIDRELKKQAKDLAKETQEASEDAEQTLKDTYQQTADKIQEFSRGSSWWSF